MGGGAPQALPEHCSQVTGKERGGGGGGRKEGRHAFNEPQQINREVLEKNANRHSHNRSEQPEINKVCAGGGGGGEWRQMGGGGGEWRQMGGANGGRWGGWGRMEADGGG